MSACCALAAPSEISSAATAPASHLGWGTPFRIVAPAARDLTGAQVVFDASGESAITYGIEDEDAPASATARLLTRTAAGALGRSRQLSGAQQVLGLAFSGTSIGILTGQSPASRSLACCSSARARELSHGVLGRGRGVVSRLPGTTLGALIPSRRGFVAALATERAVWVAQARRGVAFGPGAVLTGANSRPESFDASPLDGNGCAIAWSSGSWNPPSQSPRRIYLATCRSGSAPAAARSVLNAPQSHSVDSVVVAARGSTPTIGWIESFYDSGGAFQSRGFISDVRSGRSAAVGVRAVGSRTALIADLSIASSPHGDQVIAWRACAPGGVCEAWAQTRTARGRFGAPRRLGAVDAFEPPAVAESPQGQPLVAWIDAGRVLAAAGASGSTRLGAARPISSKSSAAADLTLAFGPVGRALGVWTDGTARQSVLGAEFRAR